MTCETLIVYEAPLEKVEVDCDAELSMAAPQGLPGPPGADGPPGPPGSTGGAAEKRVTVFAVGGLETVPLGATPTDPSGAKLFVNGLLHLDTPDYTIAGTTMTVQPSASTVAGDKLTVIFY
jgi:hypothetical protein